MMRIIFVIALLFSGVARAECSVDAVSMDGVTGFAEAVISVSDLERSASTWVEIGGWEEICRGPTRQEVLRFMGVPGVPTDEVVLRKPGTARGLVRLMQFKGVEQVQIRSSGQHWDTGGIFDLYVYVSDLERVFTQLQRAGWQGFTDPVGYQLGPFDISESIMRGPDGEVLVLMQRNAPPYDKVRFGANQPGWSLPFNSALLVKDYAAHDALFRETLGWTVHLEGNSASQPPGHTPIGLPFNIAQEYARPFAAFAPHPDDRTGSIQVFSLAGLDGYDFSDRAHAPNLGLLTLRVPVPDLQAFMADAEDVFAGGPGQMTLAPFGKVTAVVLKAPNGARIEFFQQL